MKPTARLHSLILVLILLAAACGSTPPSGSDPTTTVASTRTTVPADPTGTVAVTLGGTTYEFMATRCLVTTDVFVIDGVSTDGATTVTIRHASPPTKEVPEPSMSYLLIEPQPAFESAPAAVNFEVYDPGTGTATGSVDQGVTFTVRCER
jgi:hypothetical protein